MKRNWIKLYVDQCLRGTMISELSASQRWGFVGLLLMAGDSNEEGLIFLRKNESGEFIGYSDHTMSELLGMDIKEYLFAKEKMINFDKISVDKNNVIRIINWKKYQSEYQRQKQYRDDSCQSYSKNCNSTSNKSNTLDKDKEIDKERENTNGKTTNPTKKRNKLQKSRTDIDFNFGSSFMRWEGITEKDKELWAKTYPACNIEIELLRMADWLMSNPDKRKKRYRRFITNWLSRQQDRGGTKGIEKDNSLARKEMLRRRREEIAKAK